MTKLGFAAMRPRRLSSAKMKDVMNAVADWFLLRDYDAAKQKATDRIVKKQSRGSIFAQKGWAMSKAKLDKRSKKADADLEYIERAIKKSS